MLPTGPLVQWPRTEPTGSCTEVDETGQQRPDLDPAKARPSLPRNLAVEPNITHETFNGLPDSRTREYVLGLLMEHWFSPGATRYENWSADTSTGPKSSESRHHQPLHHLRRVDQLDAVTRGKLPPGQAGNNRRHRSAQLARWPRRQPDRTKPRSS